MLSPKTSARTSARTSAPMQRRAFVSPEPGDSWQSIATRMLPDEDLDEAVSKLKGWNLHLFTRIPSGEFLGCDVVFVAPPLEDGSGGA